MPKKRDKASLTPAEERALIGTPAGEDAEKGRQRHGTKPLTPGGDISGEDRERQVMESIVEADQTAEPERTGEEAKGRITEEILAEEAAEESEEHELTGTEIKGGSHGHGRPAAGKPGR